MYLISESKSKDRLKIDRFQIQMHLNAETIFSLATINITAK